MNISQLAEENRPRERFESFGAAALSNAELLAIILQKGSKGRNVLDISNRLLANYGLKKLPTLSLKELQKNYGIGKVKAMQIISLFELAKRKRIQKRMKIKSPADVARMFSFLKEKKREYFYALLLDTKNVVLARKILTIGTKNKNIITSRELFEDAITEGATAMILVHNHPSGDSTFSEEDTDMTKKAMTIGRLLGVEVLDHVIIGEDYTSFAK